MNMKKMTTTEFVGLLEMTVDVSLQKNPTT